MAPQSSTNLQIAVQTFPITPRCPKNRGIHDVTYIFQHGRNPPRPHASASAVTARRRPAMHHALHQRPLSHGLSGNASTRRRPGACLDHYTDFHLARFARPGIPLADRGILSTRSARHKTEPSAKRQAGRDKRAGCTTWQKSLRLTRPATKPFRLPRNSWQQLAIYPCRLPMPARKHLAIQVATNAPLGTRIALNPASHLSLPRTG